MTLLARYPRQGIGIAVLLFQSVDNSKAALAIWPSGPRTPKNFSATLRSHAPSLTEIHVQINKNKNTDMLLPSSLTCDSTASSPVALASVSMKKLRKKSGNTKIGVDALRRFSSEKACSPSKNFFFLCELFAMQSAASHLLPSPGMPYQPGHTRHL